MGHPVIGRRYHRMGSHDATCAATTRFMADPHANQFVQFESTRQKRNLKRDRDWSERILSTMRAHLEVLAESCVSLVIWLQHALPLFRKPGCCDLILCLVRVLPVSRKRPAYCEEQEKSTGCHHNDACRIFQKFVQTGKAWLVDDCAGFWAHERCNVCQVIELADDPAAILSYVSWRREWINGPFTRVFVKKGAELM